MRKVINISLPERLEQYVKGRVEKGEFGTVSEYFRDLIRMDQKRERSIAVSLGMRAHSQQRRLAARPFRSRDPDGK